MNKKWIILVVIAIIIIVSCFIGYYNYRSNHLFTPDGKVIVDNRKEKYYEFLNNIDNEQERQNFVEYGVKANIITQEEANNIK